MPRSPRAPRSWWSTAASAGRRATGAATTCWSRRSSRWATTRRCCVQSGKPVGVFRTHADAPRVLIANSNLVAHWATWEQFHALDRLGLMMYGQMTAGSWIYIGSQGIIQGTYETFVEAGRQHYDGDLAGKWILTGGLGGMGGAQPLAATMAGACLLAVECRASRIERRLENGYLDRMATDLDEALALIEDSCAARRALSVGPPRQRRRDLSRAGAARRAARPGDRPDRGARPAARLSAGRLDGRRNGRRCRRRTRRRSSAPPSSRWRSRCAPCSTSTARACRRSTTATTSASSPRRGGRQRVRLPGLRPGLHPAAVLPRQGAVPLGRAVGRSRGHLPDRRQGEGAVPRRPPLAQLAGPGAGAHPVPGPAGADLLARPGRAGQGRPRLQRDGGERRAERAGGDRPRPSRQRLGREPQPRDRGDAGRLGRGRRLAAPERAAQHRLGRHLGLDPPWRRGRHRLFAACRHGRSCATAPPRPRAGSSAC